MQLHLQYQKAFKEEESNYILQACKDVCMAQFSKISKNWTYLDRISLDSDFIKIGFNSALMKSRKSKAGKG